MESVFHCDVITLLCCQRQSDLFGVGDNSTILFCLDDLNIETFVIRVRLHCVWDILGDILRFGTLPNFLTSPFPSML